MTQDSPVNRADKIDADKTEQTDSLIDRHRVILIRIALSVALLQFATIILLPIFQPEMDRISWLILLAFFTLTVVLGIAAVITNKNVVKSFMSQNDKPSRGLIVKREKPIRDSLTNLFSRHYLEETLERELHRSLRSHTSVGIIKFEIDQFHNFVDSYGAEIGDMILKKFAEFLKERVRISDIVCRYRDQEFVLIISEASRELTIERAEHLRIETESIQLNYEGQIIKGLTISGGVAIYPEHGLTIDTLLHNANDALQAAKTKGQNQITVFQKSVE
jgi:diguanylate cyclase (GGDEF)-like protein